jgi:hypothetical protein
MEAYSCSPFGKASMHGRLAFFLSCHANAIPLPHHTIPCPALSVWAIDIKLGPVLTGTGFSWVLGAGVGTGLRVPNGKDGVGEGLVGTCK